MRYLVATACTVAALGTSVFASGHAASSESRDSQSAIAVSPRVTVRSTEVREFDWAKLQARARIAYISSGPRTFTDRMIDNDLQTAFRFPTYDSSPTVIVELAQSAQLHRVSVVFKGEDAQLDVYLLNELPKDPRDLRSLTPSATIVDPPKDRGTATVEFSASSARYVALRWIRTRFQDPLTIAEISAFSNDSPDLTSGQDPRFAASSGPTFVTTEPPPVPVVSP